MMNRDAQSHLSIAAIEAELKKRVADYPPTPWRRKQGDAWDTQTNFIYRIHRWDALRSRLTGLDKPLADYAINRWFNFWSARAVENIFTSLPGVQPSIDQYDRLVDFTINGITFDHKTSVFPQRYPKSPKFAWNNKTHLISWLYAHQSRQQRYHTANRLFIILYARDGNHWRLRAEIGRLQCVIQRYVDRFSPARLVSLNFTNNTALSDVIWCFK